MRRAAKGWPPSCGRQRRSPAEANGQPCRSALMAVRTGGLIVSQPNASDSAPSLMPARRSFLGLAGLAGAGLASLAAPRALGADLDGSNSPAAEPAASNSPTNRDIAILRFLAAAELLETDLWQQYAELAQGNPGYREALESIDDDLPVYTVDVTEDELSHAQFINAFLRSIGADPVNLDAFRVIPSPHVRGLRKIGRLTNLTDLTVDTSYFTRYQRTGNPDFGDTFPQIATIRDQPAIPTSNGVGDRALAGIARVAAFHFASDRAGWHQPLRSVRAACDEQAGAADRELDLRDRGRALCDLPRLAERRHGVPERQRQARGPQSDGRQAWLVPCHAEALHIPKRAISDLLGHPPLVDRPGRRAGGRCRPQGAPTCSAASRRRSSRP